MFPDGSPFYAEGDKAIPVNISPDRKVLCHPLEGVRESKTSIKKTLSKMAESLCITQGLEPPPISLGIEVFWRDCGVISPSQTPIFNSNHLISLRQRFLIGQVFGCLVVLVGGGGRFLMRLISGEFFRVGS